MQAGEKAYSKFWLLKWFVGNIRDHFYSELGLELIMLRVKQTDKTLFHILPLKQININSTQPLLLHKSCDRTRLWL